MGTLVVTSKHAGAASADSIAIYFAIAAYMIAVTPYIVHGHTALGMLCMVLSLWRLYIIQVNAPPPSSDTTSIVGVVAIVILAGLTELRLNPQSGVIALMVLIGCRNLSARTPEQLTNNLLLLPFLPMGLFLTVDPSWATGFLFAFLWVWLSALVRVWQREGAVRTALGQGLRTLCLLAPLILLSYFMLPRPHAWWNQQQQKQAQTGMSSTLKPGNVGRLSQNQETAFYATFPNGIPLDSSGMYWRGLTLSTYKDGEWSGSSRALNMPEDWNERNEASNQGIAYQVLFPSKDDNYLYSLEYSSLSKGRMTWDGTAMIPERLNRQTFTTYEGTYYPKAAMNIKPVRSEMEPVQNDNPAATALAKQLWAQSPSAEAFLTRLREQIQKEGFIYSLEPGEMKNNWIDTFLERKKGFCEHYAGTVAYMLRQVGVPARVVVGFQGAKPYTKANTTLDVPYSAAHAWIEYWSAPAEKWVRLDPTSWVAPERLTAQHWQQTDAYKSKWWSEFGFLAVQMESQWKMWVTYYDADQQRELWRKMSNVDWRPVALGLMGLLALGWLSTGRRWYALSPSPLHQWQWTLQNADLPSSTTVVAYKQRVAAEYLHVRTWLEHVEISLYADASTKISDYCVWFKALASIKSTTYKRSNKNFKLNVQTH